MNFNDKVKLVVETIKSQGYTAYFLSKHTDELSMAGIQKMLKSDSKMNLRSVDILFDTLVRMGDIVPEGADAPKASLGGFTAMELAMLNASVFAHQLWVEKEYGAEKAEKYNSLIEKISKLKAE